MTAKPQTEETGEDQPVEQLSTSQADEVQESSRIAALLRERFGIER
jgi:hypothetical protein